MRPGGDIFKSLFSMWTCVPIMIIFRIPSPRTSAFWGQAGYLTEVTFWCVASLRCSFSRYLHLAMSVISYVEGIIGQTTEELGKTGAKKTLRREIWKLYSWYGLSMYNIFWPIQWQPRKKDRCICCKQNYPVLYLPPDYLPACGFGINYGMEK